MGLAVSQGDRERPEPTDHASSAEGPFREEALDWFIRLRAEDQDPATQRAFRAWCESHPGRAAAFARVSAMWGEPEFARATENVARATKLSVKPRSVRRKGAALIVAAAVLIYGASSIPDLLLWVRADYMTATGERRSITLPDGSRMVLNTATAVSLDYTQDRRAVTVLDGEAYFDVARDLERPFVVDGNFSRVMVTGTAFDVRLDPDQDDIALARGAVDVARLEQPMDRTGLRPGEAVNVGAFSIAPIRAVDPATAFAWVDGRITFTERPFREVLDQLRRYYRGRVVLWNSQLGDTNVSGSYRLDDASLAIRSLAEAAGASVTALPGLIILR